MAKPVNILQVVCGSGRVFFERNHCMILSVHQFVIHLLILLYMMLFFEILIPFVVLYVFYREYLMQIHFIVLQVLFIERI